MDDVRPRITPSLLISPTSVSLPRLYRASWISLCQFAALVWSVCPTCSSPPCFPSPHLPGLLLPPYLTLLRASVFLTHVTWVSPHRTPGTADVCDATLWRGWGKYAQRSQVDVAEGFQPSVRFSWPTPAPLPPMTCGSSRLGRSGSFPLCPSAGWELLRIDVAQSR